MDFFPKQTFCFCITYSITYQSLVVLILSCWFRFCNFLQSGKFCLKTLQPILHYYAFQEPRETPFRGEFHNELWSVKRPPKNTYLGKVRNTIMRWNMFWKSILIFVRLLFHKILLKGTHDTKVFFWKKCFCTLHIKNILIFQKSFQPILLVRFCGNDILRIFINFHFRGRKFKLC